MMKEKRMRLWVEVPTAMLQTVLDAREYLLCTNKNQAVGLDP